MPHVICIVDNHLYFTFQLGVILQTLSNVSSLHINTKICHVSCMSANSLQNPHLLAYKARHSNDSMLPSYLQDLLLDHYPTWQLRSSPADLFSEPAATSTFASRAFSVSVSTVWNWLKPDLHAVDSFKSHLNSTLFLPAYGKHKIAQSRAIQRFWIAACLRTERSTNQILYCIVLS